MQLGPYRLESELARGGMGVVYRGRGPDGEAVAVKLLLEQSFPDPELERRFRREAEALEALDHPGILAVRAHGVERGRLYMVMDLLSGPTLADLVKQKGPLSAARAVDLALRLAEALEHAHQQGIVHRDLKPENVILQDGAPVLVDFGLVRQVTFDRSRLTETGTILGSPRYMAPEQALGSSDVGPGADLYAVGATLYFLLTGKAPFEGSSVLAILSQVAHDEPTRPSLLQPGLAPDLEAVVLRCMEKDPSRRFPTAAALGRALRGLAEVAPPARAPSTRALAWLALGLAMSAALGAIALLASRSKAGPPGAGEVDRPTTIAEDDPTQLDSAQAYVERAEAALAGGRLDLAVADFERVLEGGALPPGLAQVVRGRRDQARFELAQQPGRAPSAEAQARAAAALDDGSEQFERKRLGESLTALDAALKLDPLNARAYAVRGEARLLLRRFSGALGDFDRAVQLETGVAAVYANRAVCNQKLGRHSEALADLDAALRLDPDNALIYLSRGVVLARLERHEEAILDFDRALALDPQSVSALANRGASAAALGRFAQAIGDFDKALAASGDPEQEAQLRRWRDTAERNAAAFASPSASAEQRAQAEERARSGRALRERGRYPEALTEFDRALRMDPRNGDAYLNRGQCKAALDRHAEAIEDFERALFLGPRSAEVYRNLATSRAGLGAFALAVADFDRALALQPDSPEDYAGRGISKASLDRHLDALDDFDAALARSPRDVLVLVYRAASRAKLGRAREALQDFDAALALNLPPAQVARLRELRQEVEQTLLGARSPEGAEPRSPEGAEPRGAASPR